MAESTLSLNKDELYARVGKFLGYGRGAKFNDTEWADTQVKDIEDCVHSGLRQFYYPTSSENGPPYDWSFLKPWASISLKPNEPITTLPDDFGGFEGKLTILAPPTSTGGGTIPWSLELTNSGQVRMRFAEFPDRTGRPLLAALEPMKGSTQLRGQRQQLVIFPIPDAGYVLEFQYYVLPDALTAESPFHYGGMAHAETVMEACLMAAEQFLDDASTVHAMKFQERLTASIGMDKKNKAQVFGVNMDLSDGRLYKGRDWRNSWPSGLGTYNGVSLD